MTKSNILRMISCALIVMKITSIVLAMDVAAKVPRENNNYFNSNIVQPVLVYEDNTQIIIQDLVTSNVHIFYGDGSKTVYSMPTYGSIAAFYKEEVVYIYLYRENTLVQLEDSNINIVNEFEHDLFVSELEQNKYTGDYIVEKGILKNIYISSTTDNITIDLDNIDFLYLAFHLCVTIAIIYFTFSSYNLISKFLMQNNAYFQSEYKKNKKFVMAVTTLSFIIVFYNNVFGFILFLVLGLDIFLTTWRNVGVR